MTGASSVPPPAGQVQSPLRQTGVPPVPPSTPTGSHKVLVGEGVQSPSVSSTTGQQQQGGKAVVVKTAPADSTTKTTRPAAAAVDDARTSAMKSELLAKAAQNKKPQLLEELCRFEQNNANKVWHVCLLSNVWVLLLQTMMMVLSWQNGCYTSIVSARGSASSKVAMVIFNLKFCSNCCYCFAYQHCNPTETLILLLIY